MWTRSGYDIDNDFDINVVELFEVGPMQYQTSVLFNSMDKARDEGLYIFKVEALRIYKYLIILKFKVS